MFDPVLMAAVWDRYERDRPRAGKDLQVWIAKLAEESGVQEATVRRIIADGAGAMLNAISDRVRTSAQQVADLIGADMVAALEVVRESFGATKKKVLLDKQGRPKLIDETPIKDGGPGFVPENMIYIEVPDWHARLAAVRIAAEIHGARAPMQIEVDSRSVTLDLTPNAALAELERLATALPKLQAAIGGRAGTVTRTSRRRTTVDGAVSDPGRPLLADGMHPDEGRTGQG